MRKKKSVLRTLVSSACVALGAVLCGQANAIEIYALDAGGNVAGGPLSVIWGISPFTAPGGTTLSDNSAGAGTDWQIEVGKLNFGSPESGSQTSAIYGAGTSLSGAYGYRVVFDFDGFTWDSYNGGGTPNPGASTGYWDSFAVNINKSTYYWGLVTGGSGTLSDPIVAPDPAGTPVIDSSGTRLPGITWAWGGLDYAAGFFEEQHSNGVVLNLMGSPSDTFYISATLDTATTPSADGSYPSWGAFNAGGTVPPPPGGQSQDVPEPATLLLVGLGVAGLVMRRRRS